MNRGASRTPSLAVKTPSPKNRVARSVSRSGRSGTSDTSDRLRRAAWASQQMRGAAGARIRIRVLNPASLHGANEADVLLRIYAKCVVGQDELAKLRISEALRQS